MRGEICRTLCSKGVQYEMTKHDEWVPFSWHCPNCGALVTGYKNAQGTIKLECERCRVVMVRSFKGRRHDSIDLYAPKGAERL